MHLCVPLRISLGIYITFHFGDDFLINFFEIIKLQLPHIFLLVFFECTDSYIKMEIMMTYLLFAIFIA
jgi:hypothetical protein